MSDRCLAPTKQFSDISWQEQVNFQWDDELDCYSASSLEQQFADRHVAPLWYVIVIPSQPVITLTNLYCVLSGEATNTNFMIFGLTRPGIEPTIYHIRDEHANHYTTNAIYFELRTLDKQTVINIEICNKCLCDNDPQKYRNIQRIILRSPYSLQQWTSVSTALEMNFSQKRVSRMITMILVA